jgi:PAS domain S-box-containing protein
VIASDLRLLCSRARSSDRPFHVHDTHADPGLVGELLVFGGATVRFFSGEPIRLRSGRTVGALGVADFEPRELTSDRHELVRSLAGGVGHLLDAQLAVLGEQHQREDADVATTWFRRTFGSMSHGVLVHGPDGGIEHANAAAESVLGRARSELFGRHTSELGWRVLEPVAERVGELAMPGVVIEVRRPDGATRWLNVAAEVTTGRYDPPRRTVVRLVDVTEMKLMRDRLREDELL